MSASVTGETPSLSQVSGLRPKWRIAMAAPSRAASRMRARSASSPSRARLSFSGKRHSLDQECGSGSAEISVKIVSRHHVEEHVLEIGRYGDFRYRPSQFAILDPEAGCSARIFARHHVDPLAEHFGPVAAGLKRANQFFRALFPRLDGK